MIDRMIVADPPEFPTHYQHDDTPEALGDDFTLSAEEDAKIDRAARWGRDLILEARAGSQQALQTLRERMHITEYRTVR